MAGNVDDVVGTAHDVEIAIGVLEARVGGLVVAGKLGEITLLEALVLLPQRRQAGRRQRQLDHDRAHLIGRQRAAGFVDDVDLVAGHCDRRRAVFDRQHAEADRVAGDRPAGLGLPPMVNHRHVEDALGPHHRVRVGALAREEQRAEFG